MNFDIKRLALAGAVAFCERRGIAIKQPELETPLTDAEREAAHQALDDAERDLFLAEELGLYEYREQDAAWRRGERG